jgi:hypothetical protein
LIEGTAEAARLSDTVMRRNNFEMNLRTIAASLLAAEPLNLPYEAQDFWGYFGRKIGRGLEYLQPLFERGGTTTAAVAFFADVHLLFA